MCVRHSLRFTPSAAPVDLLAANMVAEPFLPHTCEQALARLKTDIYHYVVYNVTF